MSAIAPLQEAIETVLGPETGRTSGAEKKDEKLSLKEYKKLMNKFFTVRRAVVKACGHKIDENNPDGPKNNCEECWFAFFNNNGELVKTVLELSQKHGSGVVVNMRGVKFLKMFRRFLSTLAAWKAESEVKEIDEAADGSGT